MLELLLHCKDKSGEDFDPDGEGTPEEDAPLDKKGSGNNEQGKSLCGIKRCKLIPAQRWTVEILLTVLCRYHPLKITKTKYVVVCSIREFYKSVRSCVF